MVLLDFRPILRTKTILGSFYTLPPLFHLQRSAKLAVQPRVL